jgi:hypothetical protein
MKLFMIFYANAENGKTHGVFFDSQPVTSFLEQIRMRRKRVVRLSVTNFGERGASAVLCIAVEMWSVGMRSMGSPVRTAREQKKDSAEPLP